MTATPPVADHGCADPHDHTSHDHPPTGADVVRDLVRGLSVLALVLPALGVLMLLMILPLAPSSILVLALGMALGATQLLVLVATSLLVARTKPRLAVHPALVAGRSAAEEGLRVAAAFTAVLLWRGDARPELGVWLGAGAALVWLALATAQTVSTRQRIARPSQWSKQAVATLLNERVTARSTVVMRLLDVLGTVFFQVGATVLVILAPVMAVATAVLSIGSGLATLMLQRRTPAERTHSPWAFAPLSIGVLTLSLALLGLATL